MLVRSSSTPVLGALLQSGCHSPAVTSPAVHFADSPASAAYHPPAISCHLAGPGSDHERLRGAGAGMRRTSSEGNLASLAGRAGAEDHHHLLPPRARPVPLETIQSFTGRRASSTDDEDEDDDFEAEGELSFGQFSGFVGGGGSTYSQEHPLFLARGLGIDRLGSGLLSAASTPVAKKPKQFPLVQTKIVDFFKIQRSSLSAGSSESKKRKRKPAGALVVSKKKRKLLPFVPSEDPAQRLRQMASLATALTATGAVFSNHLTYQPSMAPRSANRAALEDGGMQVLPKEDAEALSQCQRMMERGECPPLVVVYDPVEGFTVEADRFIRDLTIITEYVGDVDYLRNRENDDGDSMMTLLSASSPSRSLVVCPDRRSNIARFINGINNHTPEGRKKQNLKCVRYDVGGECRALLVANRDISKGERLYYDYNGSEHEYPTHHFV